MEVKRKNYARVGFFVLFCFLGNFFGFGFWVVVLVFFLLVAKNPPYCCSVVVASKGMEWKEIAFGRQK